MRAGRHSAAHFRPLSPETPARFIENSAALRWCRFGGEGRGEGELPAPSELDCRFDSLMNFVGLPQYVIARNPQYLISKIRQHPVSFLISRQTFASEVMLAVDFDDQLQRNAAEIHSVGFNHIFAAEFLSATAAISQHLPDCPGKLIGCGSLIASELGRFRVSTVIWQLDFSLRDASRLQSGLL